MNTAPNALSFRRSPLVRLLGLIGSYWIWMLLAAILGFVTIASSILLMANAASIIARAALHPSIGELQVAIVGVRFFGIARGVFRYLERIVSHEVTFRLLARLRVWFFAALEPLAPARLARYRGGDLLARIVADIETLQHFYGRVVAPPAVALLTGFMMWVFMADFDLALAVTLLIFLLLAGIGLPLLTLAAGQGAGRQIVQSRGVFSATLIDGIQGISEIVAFGAQAAWRDRIRQLDSELANRQWRIAQVSATNDALGTLIVGLAALAVVVVAAPLVAAQQITGVDLAIVALATLACFEAVLPLSQTALLLGQNAEAARRLFEIVDAEALVPDPEHALPASSEASLTFEGVHFRYGPNEPFALEDITFSVPAGAMWAVVGTSGAGKSTLINLVLRFWDAASGKVMVGGQDIRQMVADEVRQMVGVVTQRTTLFNATVRENLLLARRSATEADLIRAATDAQIHDFISALPQGYDTWIGEGGARLSGGERQRLAIARAFLKDAPILLLDEATANLDSVTEAALLLALQRLIVGRTTLMVTHRLAGLEHANHVLVLHKGRIVERGHPAILQTAGGPYARLFALQREIIDT